MHWARVAPAISVTSRWRRAGPVSFVSRGHGPWDRECFYVLCACAVRVCIIHIRRISACGSFHLHVHVHVRTPSRRADSATQWPTTTAHRTLQLSRDARPVPGDARPAARPDDTLETTRATPRTPTRPRPAPRATCTSGARRDERRREGEGYTVFPEILCHDTRRDARPSADHGAD